MNCLLLLTILSLPRFATTNSTITLQKEQVGPLRISRIHASIYITDCFCLSKCQSTMHCLLLPYLQWNKKNGLFLRILISCFRKGGRAGTLTIYINGKSQYILLCFHLIRFATESYMKSLMSQTSPKGNAQYWPGDRSSANNLGCSAKRANLITNAKEIEVAETLLALSQRAVVHPSASDKNDAVEKAVSKTKNDKLTRRETNGPFISGNSARDCRIRWGHNLPKINDKFGELSQF